MELESWVTAALASGCGAIIQWLFGIWAADRAEDGHPVSPKSKRRIMIGLCVTVPSALIGVLWLSTGQYSWQEHVMAVGLAFVTSQVLHGETKLPTGEQVRAQDAAQQEAIRQSAATLATPEGSILVKEEAVQ